MWIFLTPTDTWLFRDGRPFDANADHRARSIFPPAPSVIQGALRSALLGTLGVSTKDTLPQAVQALNESYSALSIRGPWIAKQKDTGVEAYYPCPADIVLTDNTAAIAKPNTADAVVSNLPAGLTPLTVTTNGKPKPAHEYYLSATSLNNYLSGEQLAFDEATARGNGNKPNDFTHISTLYRLENRLGIKMDSGAKRPADGFLYQAEFVRPEPNVGLLIEVTGITEEVIKQTSVWRLGGEGHTAQLQIIQTPKVGRSSTANASNPKLYFSTPTLLAETKRDATPALGITAEIVGAALPRYQAIGGWDLVKNAPKPIQRYVAPGSVFYLSDSAPTADYICAEHDDNESHTQHGRNGFGQYLLGTW